MKLYPVKFRPIAFRRVWGGHRLKEWFGVQDQEPVGEYWVLSGHPRAVSVAENGELAGKTLVELTERFPEEYLGASPQGRFPLLVKFLEAQAPLSVQLHPPDEYARRVEGDFGKTEAWYVLDHQPGARVVYGHSFQDREEFERAVREKRVEEFLRYREIVKDALVFVPAQTLHALLEGTLLIEIQQTSDVTYRVYDWERVDRELHVEKAAEVLTFGEKAIPVQADTERLVRVCGEGVRVEQLVACEHFVLEKVELERSRVELSLGRAGNPDVLVVADGEGWLMADGGERLLLKRGDTVLVPSSVGAYRLETEGKWKVLKAFY
jgi:mannose-6-phosphate isomerase